MQTIEYIIGLTIKWVWCILLKEGLSGFYRNFGRRVCVCVCSSEIPFYFYSRMVIIINYLVYALLRRRWWHPTPVLLPGKSHGRRSLVGCSPWGCKESDMTEWLHFHFSLSCMGEGNGNPLQCSCLENPRDGGEVGALWAAISGVPQSQTRLKRLSSSSSSIRPSW